MSKRTLHLKDNISFTDKMSVVSHHPQTLWKRTEVLIGYDRYTNDLGMSDLKEVCFRTENIVPIGGVQYAMEQIFGVTGPINTGYLNDIAGIGSQTDDIKATDGRPYPIGHKVCLFGVGTGGCGDSIVSVVDTRYNERELVDMIPLRYTNDELNPTDKLKYYGKKEIDGITGYFLKKFDQEPEIRHLWKDGTGEDFEDGTIVDSTVFTSKRKEAIESFTEILCTVNKKDVKEWFKENGGIELSRINTVGLFSAVYNPNTEDYEKIKLFSKLNIPNEPLSLSKDLQIIYRTYGA